jgi:hypothetical protein
VRPIFWINNSTRSSDVLIEFYKNQ